MAAHPARLRDAVTALAAVRFDHAQIVDGRVTDPDAAALILQAVQAHLRVLVACLPAPKAARVRPAVAVDTAGMTDAELFAYYKRTAPTEDLRFFLRGRLSYALRRRAEAVTKPTTADLVLLWSAWRTERLAEERAAGIPAIGTAEWHAQYTDVRPAGLELPAGDAETVELTEALS
jgi:hypothetical protein